jgi:hypothetical protein
MSELSGESIDQRRARLAADIARQRGEFGAAFRNLERPIHYTENAMRGFGFLRENAWIFSAVSTSLTVTSTVMGLFGLGKGKPSALTTAQRKRLSELERERLPKGFAGKVMKWGGHGFRAFKIYRRIKRFIP